MPDVFQPSGVFGTYTGVEVVSAAGQTEIVANLISLVGLLGATMSAAGAITEWNAPRSTGAAASPPNFNHIPEATRRLIINEIAAIAVKIEAMPTA
jgi:hypothetical protein